MFASLHSTNILDKNRRGMGETSSALPTTAKKKNLLSPVCTYGGEGRGLVVSYICLISSSIFNTVLTSSVPASWDSSLHIPYHLCHGNEYVMNQQAWLHKVHSILPTLLQHADFGLGPIIFDMIPELDMKLASLG